MSEVRQMNCRQQTFFLKFSQESFGTGTYGPVVVASMLASVFNWRPHTLSQLYNSTMHRRAVSAARPPTRPAAGPSARRQRYKQQTTTTTTTDTNDRY